MKPEEAATQEMKEWLGEDLFNQWAEIVNSDDDIPGKILLEAFLSLDRNRRKK